MTDKHSLEPKIDIASASEDWRANSSAKAMEEGGSISDSEEEDPLGDLERLADEEGISDTNANTISLTPTLDVGLPPRGSQSTVLQTTNSLPVATQTANTSTTRSSGPLTFRDVEHARYGTRIKVAPDDDDMNLVRANVKDWVCRIIEACFSEKKGLQAPRHTTQEMFEKWLLKQEQRVVSVHQEDSRRIEKNAWILVVCSEPFSCWLHTTDKRAIGRCVHHPRAWNSQQWPVFQGAGQGQGAGGK